MLYTNRELVHNLVLELNEMITDTVKVSQSRMYVIDSELQQKFYELNRLVLNADKKSRFGLLFAEFTQRFKDVGAGEVYKDLRKWIVLPQASDSRHITNGEKEMYVADGAKLIQTHTRLISFWKLALLSMIIIAKSNNCTEIVSSCFTSYLRGFIANESYIEDQKLLSALFAMFWREKVRFGKQKPNMSMLDTSLLNIFNW